MNDLIAKIESAAEELRKVRERIAELERVIERLEKRKPTKQERIDHVAFWNRY